MNTQQFFASTHREAMRRLRAELGDEALILSSRNIDGGVEIVALRDPIEPALPAQAPVAPAAMPEATQAMMQTLLGEIQSMRGAFEAQHREPARRNTDTREVAFLRHGLNAGFSEALTRKLWRDALGAAKGGAPDEGLKHALAERLTVSRNDEWLMGGGIYALVGPTGVGKTTTVAKLAARFSMRGVKDAVALITTDTQRVGGREQLLTYGNLFGIEAHAARSREEVTALLERLEGKRLILIDTVGVGQRDQRLSAQLAMLPLERGDIKPLVVLDATRHGDTLDDVASVYRSALGGAALAGCILSKTDEAVHIAGALDVAIRHGLRVFCLANGQNVTEHLDWPRRETLVERVLAPREASAFLPVSPKLNAVDDEATDNSRWARQALQQGKRLRACVDYLRKEVDGFSVLERLLAAPARTVEVLGDPARQLDALRARLGDNDTLDIIWQRKTAKAPISPGLVFTRRAHQPLPIFIPLRGLPISAVGRAVWLAERLPHVRLRHHFNALPDDVARQALAQFSIPWRAWVRGNTRITHNGERLTMTRIAEEMVFEPGGQIGYKGRQVALQFGTLGASVAAEKSELQAVQLIVARLVDPLTNERVATRYGIDAAWNASLDGDDDRLLWLMRSLAVDAEAPLRRRAEALLADTPMARDSTARTLSASLAALVAWRFQSDERATSQTIREQLAGLTGARGSAPLEGMIKLCTMLDALNGCMVSAK